MASKSKKRRRVFRASCILAALIIAGSSFAWFTSKDEVTNRLTANSDYGVSIVESFTPPKNWLPGQEINKDVYAVNTGNIAAFVKEDVKGVLNYTYETKVNAWDEDCVELTLDQVKAIQGETTEDGFKTMEAGGYLAWTDATTTTDGTEDVYVIDGAEVAASAFPSVTATATDSAGQNQKNFTNTYTVDNTTYYLENLNDGAVLYTIENGRYTASTKTLTVTQGSTTSPAITPGPVYSGREQDITNPWTPTEEGTYIFRRSIGGTADNPTFTYAGYYYDGNDKYYKIVIGNDDDYRAAEDHNTTPVGYEFDVSVDSDKLGTGVTVNEDGSINGTPKIAYVKDVDVKDKQVNFKYEEAVGGDHGPRLVAEYAADLPTTKIDGVEYDASAMAARTEVDYYNKLGASNKATVEYEQAKAEYDYAKALSDARDTLIDAAIARKNADDALNGTDGAADEYQDKWEGLQSATDGAITDYGTDVRTPFVSYYLVKEDENGAPPALFSADTVSRIKDETANPDLVEARKNLTKLEGLQDEIADLDAQLWTTLKPISGKGNDTPNLTPDEVNQKIATAKGLIDQLNDKIVAYKNAYSAIVDDNTITATALQLDDDTANKKAGIQAAADALVALKDDMDDAAGAYKTAYDDYQAAVKANQKAEDTWKDAIDTYNSTVGNPSAAAVADDPDTDEDESAAAVAATGATLTYESIVKKEAPAIQPTPPASYSEANTATLVNDYSANKTGNGNTNPKIDKTDATAEFATYAAMAKTPTPTTTEYSLTTKKEAMDEALAATNVAKNDYDDAVEALNSASTIKIYVNLANDYATNWTIDPADATLAGSQDVDFYLNSILDAGETSPKLIDSVELSDETTARAYKDLTFDLNVALDSAQITYANDQRTITTEATEGWGMTPTLTTPTDIETAVAWAAPTP